MFKKQNVYYTLVLPKCFGLKWQQVPELKALKGRFWFNRRRNPLKLEVKRPVENQAWWSMGWYVWGIDCYYIYRHSQWNTHLWWQWVSFCHWICARVVRMILSTEHLPFNPLQPTFFLHCHYHVTNAFYAAK